MRAWLACAETQPSGMRRATQTMPLRVLLPCPSGWLPLPMSSMIHASSVSAIENDSPLEA